MRLEHRNPMNGFLGRGAAFAIGFAAVLTASSSAVYAGPPFLTDDPDPVEAGHWELYLATQWDRIDGQGAEGNLPQFEINYGVLDGVMLHLLVPEGFIAEKGASPVYGPGDLEVGANIRIVEEGEARPQVGTFPIAVIPLGSEVNGLGSGTVELFLPIWVMKHAGDWTFDGGGGLHFAEGDVEASFGFFGERTFHDWVTLGAEVFVTVPFDASPVRTQLNAALILDLSNVQHLLFSGGPSFGAVSGAQTYAAWQVTL